jgi:hypothetical protein
MTILRDILLTLTPEQVIGAQRRGRAGAPNPAMLAAAQEAIALGRALAAPASAQAEYEIRSVAGRQIVLDDGRAERRLTLGPKVELMAPARRAVIAVNTIGPALEKRVRELHTSGQDVLAFMLDSVGVMLLGQAGAAVRQQVEQRAVALGWGAGPVLAPGSLVGWPVSGQRELCACVALDQIAVRLTAGCMLEPQKSSSMLIGLGPEYDSSHTRPICEFCALKDSCWRRKDTPGK